MTLTAKLLLFVFCLAAAGFFAGMETGVISINRLRLLHRVRNGSRNAKIISGYLRDTDRLLGTMLIGGNLVNVLLSTLAASLAARYLGDKGLGIAALATSFLIVLFGELIPKAWFSSRPLQRCVPLARPLRLAEIVLSPFSRLLMALTTWAGGAAGNSGKRSPFVTRENLQSLTRDSEAGGQISPLEQLMISRVLALQLKTAREVMTPLASVVSLPPDATLADAADLVRKRHFQKLPVFSRDGRSCLGFLHVRDVFAELEGSPDAPVAKFLRRPFYVRSEARADDLLPMLRRNGRRMAVVRDRSGHFLGIVTASGMLRLVVGNLPSDTSGDRAAEPPPPQVFPASPPRRPAKGRRRPQPRKRGAEARRGKR